MSFNFMPVERDQLWLMPVSMTEWLPDDHLAWFIIDIVDELDLSAFVNQYREDGRGGRAYHPGVMLAVLIYAYCVGERSSRRIERKLVEDVGFRVVAANQRPDHATLARFRAGHQDAIAGLFGQVLHVCHRAGLLDSGVVAVDGTKLAGNASREASFTAQELAERIMQEAADIDQAEDLDEVGAGGRMDAGVLGKRGKDRQQRMRALLAELDQDAAEHSYDAHMRQRAAQEVVTGRPLRGRHPVPTAATHRGRTQANVTDPDSRLLPTRRGFVQGYNAQAVVNQSQVIVAAQATNSVSDRGWFKPMLDQAQANIAQVGGSSVSVALADAGYWATDNVDVPGVDVLIAPGRARNLDELARREYERDVVLTQVETGQMDTDHAGAILGMTRTRVNQLLRARRHGHEPLTAMMTKRLDTPDGRNLYHQRKIIIEPVFGQIKQDRGFRSLQRRGLAAVDSEWKLICATHNLLKVFRHQER